MRRTWVVTVLVLVVSAGCQEPTRTLVPRNDPFLQDVPVPRMFTFDPAHSSDLAGEGIEGRFVNYYYKGRAYFVDVVSFYKRACDSSNGHGTLRGDADGR